ncbi:MAG: hypothetical protein U0802_17935 [Candidatus Binatia bacterium]
MPRPPRLAPRRAGRAARGSPARRRAGRRLHRCQLHDDLVDGRRRRRADHRLGLRRRGTLQTFQAICGAGQCLYSAIDPGLLAEGDAPRAGFFGLASGTPVDLGLVAADAASPEDQRHHPGQPRRPRPPGQRLGTYAHPS